MNVKQAARRWHCTPVRVYQLLHAGAIAYTLTAQQHIEIADGTKMPETGTGGRPFKPQPVKKEPA
jgi:hypothetical protein